MSEADDLLDGTDADPWEKLQLQEVLDEIDAEQAAGIYDDGEPGGYDPEGPWRDQLHQISETVGRRERSEADRIVSDVTDQLTRRPSTEQKIAMALRRIADGDYVQDPYYRQARTADGRFGSACGPIDDLGRCSSRYHQAGCESVVAQAAATSTPEAVRAWNATVRGHAPPPGAAGAAEALGLASPSQPEPGTADMWADLLHAPDDLGGAYGDIHARMLAEMGEAEPPPYPQMRPPGPDVSAIKAALGI
jgi:hypothetical protein